VVAWLVAIRLALIFLHGKIQRAVADRLNAVAATEAVDDDKYLADLFAHPTYRFTAFLLLMVGIPLPSSADLERAIQLQREAVEAARPVHITQNPS
jgi:hypothetical protein